MDYRYTECGLDNVMISNMKVITDDAGEEVYSIPNVMGLHKLIARCIVSHNNAISPKELRFLRTEMGLTQQQLGEIVKKDHQTIGRWERGEVPLDATAELVIRLLAEERLDLQTDIPVAELAKRCVPSAEFQVIRIDGRNPKNYKPMRVAA